jgi:hypothetical protein
MGLGMLLLLTNQRLKIQQLCEDFPCIIFGILQCSQNVIQKNIDPKKKEVEYEEICLKMWYEILQNRYVV